MKVVLLSDVKGTGKAGTIVNVSEGYAANFLFPKKLATEATASALNDLKGQNEAFAYKKETELNAAKEMQAKLSELSVTISAKAGANDRLFGSVTNKDVAEALLNQHHIKIDKRRFEMQDIKNANFCTLTLFICFEKISAQQFCQRDFEDCAKFRHN